MCTDYNQKYLQMISLPKYHLYDFIYNKNINRTGHFEVCVLVSSDDRFDTCTRERSMVAICFNRSAPASGKWLCMLVSLSHCVAGRDALPAAAAASSTHRMSRHTASQMNLWKHHTLHTAEWKPRNQGCPQSAVVCYWDDFSRITLTFATDFCSCGVTTLQQTCNHHGSQRTNFVLWHTWSASGWEKNCFLFGMLLLKVQARRLTMWCNCIYHLSLSHTQ